MTFADKLTSLRILLIPCFVSLLFYFTPKTNFVRYLLVAVFGLAVATDFFDGLVARIRNEKTEFGQILDPLADKLLLITAYISLYALRGALPLRFQIPLWVVLIVVSRDSIILIGVLTLHFLKMEIPITPSWWGKLATTFQMGTILGVILDFSLAPILWTVAVVFTVISGCDYFLRGVRATNGKSSSAHP